MAGLPDNFPLPDALEAMAQAIGNATVGPVQIDEMYVVRRGGTWVYVGSVTIQES